MTKKQTTAQVVEELTEAIRLTREYVGPDILPAVFGWSWYDALVKYAPEKAADFEAKVGMPCVYCGKPDNEKPIAFQATPYCSENHKKIANGEKPTPQQIDDPPVTNAVVE
jgi:endogenous inhibitor of DNA gyrase (YacG/DUF329 family)